tara:strand:+ start:1827 stop:2441 length:615 start_codon:yes stop_codon:yes gene_type:complete
MSTADKPSIPPKDENTVPPKLISGYNDIIKSLVDYTPTGNFKMSIKDSGVYIEDKDNPRKKYFSFHFSKEEDGKVKPHRIHLKNLPCSNSCRVTRNEKGKKIKKHVIDLKLILKEEEEEEKKNIFISAKESQSDICKACLEDDSIQLEINNLNKFFEDYITDNPTILRDTTPIPFDPTALMMINKYHEYKLKYLILKSLTYNNN